MSILEKRLLRERAAREAAEKILEEKSKELYFKNKELETLNEKLNATLEIRRQELHDSEAQRFSLFQNSAMGIAFDALWSDFKCQSDICRNARLFCS